MTWKIASSQHLGLLAVGISQEQGVRKETNDIGLEMEHQGRSGSSFSHHAATSNAELLETHAGMC